MIYLRCKLPTASGFHPSISVQPLWSCSLMGPTGRAELPLWWSSSYHTYNTCWEEVILSAMPFSFHCFFVIRIPTAFPPSLGGGGGRTDRRLTTYSDNISTTSISFLLCSCSLVWSGYLLPFLPVVRSIIIIIMAGIPRQSRLPPPRVDDDKKRFKAAISCPQKLWPE